jgi:hypothetical protein
MVGKKRHQLIGFLKVLALHTILYYYCAVARHCLQDIPVPEVRMHPLARTAAPLGGKLMVDPQDQ